MMPVNYHGSQTNLKNFSTEHKQALDDVADDILNSKYCVGGTCED